MSDDFDRLLAEWRALPPLDPQVAFFLRNQPQIEAWAALADKARPVVDLFYSALAAALRLNAPAEVFLEEQPDWCMLLWRRPEWPETRGIGICWKQGDLSSCFSGVRLEPGDAEVERVLAHPAAQGALSSEFWTVWRAESVEDPTDLQGLHDRVLTQVSSLWEDFSPLFRG